MGSGGLSFTVAESKRKIVQMAGVWERICVCDVWPCAAGEMRDVQGRLVAAGEWAAGPSTLMDVLGVASSEVLHCRALRWLLDPLGRHGIGALLLADLFEVCELEVPDLAGVAVTVEVTRDRTRADVVVSPAGGAAVVVEAKVFAGEGDRQAERLEDLWPHAGRLVFLTVGGDRLPVTASDLRRWRPMSWGWFARRVRAHLDASQPHGVQPAGLRRLEARHAAYEWSAAVLRNFGWAAHTAPRMRRAR